MRNLTQTALSKVIIKRPVNSVNNSDKNDSFGARRMVQTLIYTPTKKLHLQQIHTKLFFSDSLQTTERPLRQGDNWPNRS